MTEGIIVNAEAGERRLLGGGMVKCYHAQGSFNRSLHSVILVWCQIMYVTALVLQGRV